MIEEFDLEIVVRTFDPEIQISAYSS